MFRSHIWIALWFPFSRDRTQQNQALPCCRTEHTGLVLPPISTEERLLDLDGDGDLEYIRGGGESLIAKYARILWTRDSEVPSE